LHQPDRSLGAREVRALAHPLRIRMLEELRGGPATATMLARALGESSGATSYHLRELEKAGFVEDDDSHGHGRERWWKRSAPLVFVSSDPADDAEYEAALGQLRSVLLARDEEALARYFALAADQPREWQDATFLGGWNVFATPDEMRRLSGLLVQELDKLRRAPEDRPPGARHVYVTLRSLLQPERRSEPVEQQPDHRHADE
jgi:DNA-binding transcriptional ArsR family regulator